MKDYLWLVMILPVIVGLVFPEAGLPFAPYAVPLLFTVMVFSLLDVPLRQSLKSGVNADGLKILALQYLGFGFLGLLVAQFFPPALFIGFILVSVAPSGVSVPALVDVLRGNTGKSFSVTALSYVVAPIALPLLAFLLAGQSVPVQPEKIFQTVLLFIGLPMVLVFFLRQTRIAKTIISRKQNLNLLLISLLNVGQTAQSAHFFRENQAVMLGVFLALMAISLVVFGAGWLLGKNREDKVAFSTLAYFKNNTLSITLLNALYGPVPAAVGVVGMISAHVMLTFSTWVFRPEKSS